METLLQTKSRVSMRSRSHYTSSAGRLGCEAVYVRVSVCLRVHLRREEGDADPNALPAFPSPYPGVSGSNLNPELRSIWMSILLAGRTSNKRRPLASISAK
jgi:hypothetical protein